jgi:hypothetical protein
MNAYEQVALWYLRLNGYFAIPNFIAHGNIETRTDVDVLGVRFPHSCEFEDDTKRLDIRAENIDVVLSEVKKGRCKVNGPWRQREPNRALEYVLRRVGLFDEEASIVDAANALYSTRRYENDRFSVRIICFGRKRNASLTGVTQILWSDVISFISSRFDRYKREKADNQYWDSFGIYLWDKLATAGQQRPDVDDIVAGWERKCPCWP